MIDDDAGQVFNLQPEIERIRHTMGFSVKAILRNLLIAGLLMLGISMQPSSASTIAVNPNPTDFFNMGNSFSGPVPAVHDVYEFTLTKDADMNLTSFMTLGLGFETTVTLFLGSNVVSFKHLTGGLVYDLVVAGESRDFGTMLYVGRATFTALAAATPIPPTLFLFASGLSGLGLLSLRRRGIALLVERRASPVWTFD